MKKLRQGCQNCIVGNQMILLALSLFKKMWLITFFGHWWKHFWHGCQNCILNVQIISLWKKGTHKIFEYSKFSTHEMKNFRKSCQNCILVVEKNQMGAKQTVNKLKPNWQISEETVEILRGCFFFQYWMFWWIITNHMQIQGAKINE